MKTALVNGISLEQRTNVLYSIDGLIYLDAEKMAYSGETDDEAVDSTDNCECDARVCIHFGFNVPLKTEKNRVELHRLYGAEFEL